MTKPSDFIFNSDYLSLAETNRGAFNVVIPSMPYDQFGGFDTVTQYTTTIQYTATASAIDEFQITYDGKTWFGDSIYNPFYSTGPGPYDYSPSWIVLIYRKSATTLEIKAVFTPAHESTGAQTPMLAFYIKACSFRPPNVF